MFCTTIEATKGEQLKVSRWQYHPETTLLAAGWRLVSTYLTTSLAKAPRKLAGLPWVLQLQQLGSSGQQAAVELLDAGAAATPPQPQQPVQRAANAPCVHCGKPLQGNHYATTACFTGQHSFEPVVHASPAEIAKATVQHSQEILESSQTIEEALRAEANLHRDY